MCSNFGRPSLHSVPRVMRNGPKHFCRGMGALCKECFWLLPALGEPQAWSGAINACSSGVFHDAHLGVRSQPTGIGDSRWSFADHPPLWLLALTCRITCAATPHSVLPSRSGVQASSTWCMRIRGANQVKRSDRRPARIMPDRRCRVMPFAASGKTQ